MKIIKANKLPEKYISEFLKNTEQIQVDQIIESGYMLEVNNKISGCFMFEKIEENVYELKHFYLVTTEAIKIPTLFEAILAIAKEDGAKQVLVRSHKQMIDIILQSLNFYPQDNGKYSKSNSKTGGKWWSYTIPD